MVQIKLNEEQMVHAAAAGISRVMLNLSTGGRLGRGYQNDPRAADDPHGFLVNIYGACAELAAGLALGVEDQFPARAGMPDFIIEGHQLVSNFQFGGIGRVTHMPYSTAVDVKHSAGIGNRLIIPMAVPDRDLWYFLVLGIPPELHLVGAIHDAEARAVGRVKEYRRGGAAIYVEQRHLTMPRAVMP